jgi:carboxypeptidase Taq
MVGLKLGFFLICFMSTMAVTASKTAFDQLISKLQTITQLKRVESVLSYDRMVFMPKAPETAMARGAQMSVMAAIVHEKSTDPAIRKLLDAAEQEVPTMTGKPDAPRILELTRKTLDLTSRIPAELETRKAQHGAVAHGAWAKARETNNFASFVPALEECFGIAKEVAAAKRENENVKLYDQMLDDFEMGMSASRIDQIFSEIEGALVPLLERVRKSEHSPPTEPLKGKFPIDTQKAICQDIVTTLGYDDKHGRIDVAVHPFTSSLAPSDVRITSRFSEDEWVQGLAATIHEGGHAMYEQNLGPSGLEIDQALSMGVHESQSLFWERHVGKSKAFWKWATPKLAEAYSDFNYTPDEVYAAINAIKPDNMIRVEADELTYPIHVLLRYRLEKEIVEGNLKVEEIPASWNASMKALLGVEVPDDAQGCLQDIHWSAFAIGYFPTYLLGSSMAAQLAHYCQKDIPDMYEKIERGEFAEIKAWLTNKVHKHGKRYKSLDDLLEAQVGEKLNAKYFIEYLNTKYSELYKC